MEKDQTSTIKAKLRMSKGQSADKKKVELKLKEFRGYKKKQPIPVKSKMSSIEQRMADLTERMRKLNIEVRKRMTKTL